MPSFRADGRLADAGQELPARLVANKSTAPATASQVPLTLQGCQAVLFGRVAKIPGVKPRGSRPMNGASPKKQQSGKPLLTNHGSKAYERLMRFYLTLSRYLRSWSHSQVALVHVHELRGTSAILVRALRGY
eukprot:1139713-Pelagomonas_calceolata.AAC.2